MGCVSSRSKTEIIEADSNIMAFENSLGFNTLDVFIVDRTFHRFSYNKTMSFVQLKKAFEELKLTYNEFESFYSKFAVKNSFQMKKLNTLGILLSSSKDIDKLKVLFQNYDDDVSGTMTLDEMKAMLDDLTEIFCEFTPCYSLSLNSGNQEMYEYVKNVISIRKSIVTQIIGKIFDDKKSASFDDLIKAFNDDEGVGSILSPHKLRSYCILVRKNILKTVEYAIKTLHSGETLPDIGIENEEVIAKRNSRSKRRSRRKIC